MKILIVTPFFPHAGVHHAGGKFIFELITGLSRKHNIYLFSRIEPGEMKFVKNMEGFCDNIKLYKFKTPRNSNPLRPFLIIMSYLCLAVRANRFIRENNFDIVQVEHAETGLLIKKQKNAKLLLDAHDVISKPAERRYRSSKGLIRKSSDWLKWQIVRRMEVYIAGKFDMIFTRSQIDKDIILGLCSNLNVSVIPHPVRSCKPSTKFSKEENIILFVGAMSRDVNIKAAIFIYNKILPLIQYEVRDVKIYIVGHNPPREVRELADKSDNIVVTGFVDDVAPYYQRAAIFVSPIFIGGGIIAKNIEAMSYGLPVVTTAIGNEGIEAVPDSDLMIADTESEFARAIICLLKNPGLREQIGGKGKSYVEKKFNVDLVLSNIERSYETLFK